MILPPVDRVSVTTVVDNSVDILRPDEKVARRWSVARARKIADLRAEHGLAHHVEVARGRETARIAFDFGLTAESMTHNFRELGLDAGAIDALALSHGHSDHFGGLLGFLSAYRRRMRPGLRFYGHPNHYVARWMERNGDLVSLGRLDRGDVQRWDVDVVDVPEPVVLAEGVLLSGVMHATEPYEAIPPSLRMEEDGALVQDTFIGEQTLVAHVRDRGLVVVTSCSHRGIVGICRNATRVSGVPKIHAVLGGFHTVRPRRRADRPGGRGAPGLRGRLPRAPALHRRRGGGPARPADGEGAGRELDRLDVHVRRIGSRARWRSCPWPAP
jgi:7,8-dihydropterin-6-yl-methyl-4-(beta-D-ribofuranosyl)aminobenzene 5'-phosphate synthase